MRLAAARLRACSNAISAVISPPIRIGLFVVPAPLVATVADDDVFFALGAVGGGGFAFGFFFVVAATNRVAISRCLSSTSASRDDGGLLPPFGLNDMIMF